MKSNSKFLASFEKYLLRRAEKFPVKITYVWVSLVVVVLVLSLVESKHVKEKMWVGAFPKKPEAIEEMIAGAMRREEVELARDLYQKRRVLGASSEDEEKLEYIVYPERRIFAEIREIEDFLEDHPPAKEMLLRLSELYGKIGNVEMVRRYMEMAVYLDPNGEL